MKVLVGFLFIVSSVYASAIHEYAPAAVVKEAKVTTGISSQSRAQDNQGNYAFGYKEDHSEGGTFRKEQGNAFGQVIGSYGLRTNDGRVRIVNYVADDLHGFRAAIATNEPGTAAQPAAATSIASPHLPTAPVVEPAVHVDVHHQPSVPVPAVGTAQPLATSQITVENHHGPAIVNQNHNAASVVYAPARQIVEAPATLIKSYASSIYGPSLITDNIVFGSAKPAEIVPNQALSYEPPLNSPVNYGVPGALQAPDGIGYYEPSNVYSNPSGVGYTLGTNAGLFGYELVYRKKKK